MSKWKLLKSALNANKNNITTATPANSHEIESESVHRFKGFQELFKLKKIIWTGFKFRCKYSDVTGCEKPFNIELFLNECQKLLFYFDTSHIILDIEILKITSDFSLFKQYVSERSRHFNITNVRLLNEDSNNIIIELYVLNPSHIPMLKECQYIQRYVTYNNHSFHILTREKSKNITVDIKGLLSNHIHGIDNTGNICTWPSESILFHTIINNSKYLKYFHNKTVLELGGGMTGLCGLSLASLNICQQIVITDGHPDCVRNQVSQIYSIYHVYCT